MEIKNMPALDPEFVKFAFDNKSIHVYAKAEDLQNAIHELQKDFDVILFLGSGQFGGISLL